jgi:hypothetical protein
LEGLLVETAIHNSTSTIQQNLNHGQRAQLHSMHRRHGWLHRLTQHGNRRH